MQSLSRGVCGGSFDWAIYHHQSIFLNPWADWTLNARVGSKPLQGSVSLLQLDLTASRLVVLSVGFRSPKELGKFYVGIALTKPSSSTHFRDLLNPWADWTMNPWVGSKPLRGSVELRSVWYCPWDFGAHHTKSLRICVNVYSSGIKTNKFCAFWGSSTDFCLLSSAKLWFKGKLEASTTQWTANKFEILISRKSVGKWRNLR